MDRRAFLAAIAAGAVVTAEGLWLPGQKLISIPKKSLYVFGNYTNESWDIPPKWYIDRGRRSSFAIFAGRDANGIIHVLDDEQLRNHAASYMVERLHGPTDAMREAADFDNKEIKR